MHDVIHNGRDFSELNDMLAMDILAGSFLFEVIKNFQSMMVMGAGCTRIRRR